MLNKRILESSGGAGDGLPHGDVADLTAAAAIEIADTGLAVGAKSVFLTLPEALQAAAGLADAGELEDIGYLLNLPTSNSGSPESVKLGKYGRLCWDYTNNVMYVKDSNSGTTGWLELIA